MAKKKKNLFSGQSDIDIESFFLNSEKNIEKEEKNLFEEKNNQKIKKQNNVITIKAKKNQDQVKAKKEASSRNFNSNDIENLKNKMRANALEEKTITPKMDMQVAEYFMDVDNYADEKLRKENEKIKEELKKLQKENQKYLLEIESLNTRLEESKINFEKIEKNLQRKYPFLTEKSLKTLATAEYIYNNEKIAFDYSGVYMLYVKTLELEIRRYIKLPSRDTFGAILERMEKVIGFDKFAKRLKENRVLDVRNKAVHTYIISRIECGKIRSMLLDDGLLRRLVLLMEDVDNEEKNNNMDEKVIIDTYIYSHEGTEKYKEEQYNCYFADGICILSKKKLQFGKNVLEAKIVYINGIEYYLV